MLKHIKLSTVEQKNIKVKTTKNLGFKYIGSYNNRLYQCSKCKDFFDGETKIVNLGVLVCNQCIMKYTVEELGIK